MGLETVKETLPEPRLLWPGMRSGGCRAQGRATKGWVLPGQIALLPDFQGRVKAPYSWHHQHFPYITSRLKALSGTGYTMRGSPRTAGAPASPPQGTAAQHPVLPRAPSSSGGGPAGREHCCPLQAFYMHGKRMKAGELLTS